VINISNFTSKDNPPWLLAEPARPVPAAPPRIAASKNSKNGMNGMNAAPLLCGRLCRVLLTAGGILFGWLARVGDRLFTANDNEAYWRGWQITRVHGGLGRRYRDPIFDTLAECPRCRGTEGRGTGPCAPCHGTGRITLGEVG
jgi:hypothetical protein